MKPSGERNSATSPPCARAIERQTAKPRPWPDWLEARRGGAIEGLEHSFDLVVGDAGAVVDVQRDAGTAAIFHGIGEKVVEHLPHAERVDVNRGRLGGDGAAAHQVEGVRGAADLCRAIERDDGGRGVAAEQFGARANPLGG